MNRPFDCFETNLEETRGGATIESARTKFGMVKNVALIIESSNAYGRDLLAGVVRFMRIRGDWSVTLMQQDVDQELARCLSQWQGDGVLVKSMTPELDAALKNSSIPLVELAGRSGNDRACQYISSDDVEIGRVGAQHFLNRGYRSFAFYGITGNQCSKKRQSGFESTIQNAGFKGRVLNSLAGDSVSYGALERELEHWLRSLVPPVAVMCCNDIRGKELLDACGRCGFSVPEQVAVLGVDDDEVVCQICRPPLSSVIPNGIGIGYQAALLLDDLMDRKDPEVTDRELPPIGIKTRQSTDVVAVEDPAIAIAARFIRQNACVGISVESVAARAKISRSTLERKFRSIFGRSPQEEIRRVQIERARELLVSSSFTLDRISKMCGFRHTEYFHVVFKRLLNVTPGSFRDQAKTGSFDIIPELANVDLGLKSRRAT